MSCTVVRRHIRAPRAAVYAALLDPADVVRWKVPDGMVAEVHAFQPYEGGSLRISLTYDDPDAAGKSGAQTDTYRGRFVRLVPDTEVVEVDEFETDDEELRTPMTVTITLADDGTGTLVTGRHEDLPAGVSVEDNETGWRMSLNRLADLVERRVAGP